MSSIEKCVVNCFAVFPKNYSKTPIFGFCDICSSPNPAVVLNFLVDWMFHDIFNPLHFDMLPISSFTGIFKTTGEFHVV